MKKYLEANRQIIFWGVVMGVGAALLLDRRRLVIPEKVLRRMAKDGSGSIFPTSHGLLVMKFFTKEEIISAGYSIR